jgi:3-hydroxyisobutyrate dehydrogenase-like beta-hydroxyacid dehydrogenase
VKVALLGLGAMGSQALLRLLETGVDATGWNRSPAREALPAARIAPSLDDAVRDADLVITMLADGGAVREVLRTAALPDRVLVVDMGTSGPSASREIEAMLAARRVRFLEAPVSGSVGAARQGTLTIMAGGAVGDVDEASIVLRQLGSRIVHTGPVGTASMLKVCVNALLHTFNAALGEVLGAAERAGVGRETAYDVIGTSVVAAPFVAYKRAAFLSEGTPPVAFAVDLVRKDLALFLDSTPDAPTVATAATVVERAQRAGLGREDMATIARLFQPGQWELDKIRGASSS